ncbi:unnamed protein product, partial [Ixodes persulcatus]
ARDAERGRGVRFRTQFHRGVETHDPTTVLLLRRAVGHGETSNCAGVRLLRWLRRLNNCDATAVPGHRRVGLGLGRAAAFGGDGRLDHHGVFSSGCRDRRGEREPTTSRVNRARPTADQEAPSSGRRLFAEQLAEGTASIGQLGAAQLRLWKVSL